VISHGRSTGDKSHGFNRGPQRLDDKIGDVNNSDGLEQQHSQQQMWPSMI